MAFDIKKVTKKLFKRAEKTEKKLANKMNLKPWQLVLSVVLSVFLLFVLVMSIGIYKFNWEDKFTLGVTRILPFPAATVDSKFVYYHDYLENLNMMKKYQVEFKKVDFKSDAGKTVLANIKKDTMSRMVEDVLVKSEAKKLNVKLTTKEINDSYNDLIKSNGGKDETNPGSFADVLNKYYGLSVGDFKESVYIDRLLRQKVTEKFSSDESINADSKTKAQEILDKIKAGGDFATLAKQYSQDNTASNGGDLGLFGKGKMVPEFEQAAFSLKANEVSGLVKTVYGYHIIKVTEVKGDQIRASHILVKTKDFSTWLEDTKKSAKTKYFVKTS